MSEYMIYNTVPAYAKAPVSLELLKENPSIIFEDMKKQQADSYFVILPAGEEKLKETIVAEAKKQAYESFNCMIAGVKNGFSYQNASALKKVIEGEKAIPSSKEKNSNIISVSELIAKKKTYVELENGKLVKVEYTEAETLSTILEKGNVKDEAKAVYLGYPMGRFVTASELNSIKLETDYIKIIGKNQCMLDELQKISEYYRSETCGRCVFGHEGSAQIHMILTDITQKKGKSTDLDLLLNLCTVMKSQTMCEIGVSLATTVIDAIEKFREEIDMHIGKKTCQAGVCSKFVTYHILADKCTGCTDCMDACEDDAIQGKKRFIHVIDQDECTQCGACMEACEEEAIVKAGANKPRCPQRPIPCKSTH